MRGNPCDTALEAAKFQGEDSKITSIMGNKLPKISLAWPGDDADPVSGKSQDKDSKITPTTDNSHPSDSLLGMRGDQPSGWDVPQESETFQGKDSKITSTTIDNSHPIDSLLWLGEAQPSGWDVPLESEKFQDEDSKITSTMDNSPAGDSLSWLGGAQASGWDAPLKPEQFQCEYSEITASIDNRHLSGFYPIRFQQLEAMRYMNASEIILTLQNEESGFYDLLMSPNLHQDFVPVILALLATVSKCETYSQHQLALLNFTMSTKLYTDFVPHTLTCALYDPMLRLYLPAMLVDFMALSRKLLSAFPRKAAEVLAIAFAVCNDIVQVNIEMRLGIGLGTCAAILDMDYITGESPGISQSLRDDFRSIPVTPTQADIQHDLTSTLRPNLVGSKFDNVEHYLGVHFHLMREDFIGPLREQLHTYCNTLEYRMGYMAPNYDYKIYERVRISQPKCCAFLGLIHKVKFSNTVDMSEADWETSKQLLFSSLVCLSSDNFKTFTLATVVKRDVRALVKGVVHVRLIQNEGMEVQEFNPRQVYSMIESPVFFEAYGPVLRGLQSITDDTLPFKRYIVDAATDVAAPKYLTRSTFFDFYPLLPPEIRETRCTFYQVLDDESWPTAEDMQLDAAQYRALKSALTKELALIQGPPGTGKSFLGLKLMELLLTNMPQWCGTGSPILVICYTNHALDQFLEKILEFAPSVVRVGGQSKSEALQQYNLRNLRKRMVSRKKVICEQVYYRTFLVDKMAQIEGEVAKIDATVKHTETRILNEKALEEFASPLHYKQLRSLSGKCQKDSTKPISPIMDWLELQDMDLYKAITELEDLDDTVTPHSDKLIVGRNPCGNNVAAFEVGIWAPQFEVGIWAPSVEVDPVARSQGTCEWGNPDDHKGLPNRWQTSERCQSQSNWDIPEDLKDQTNKWQTPVNWDNPVDPKGQLDRYQSQSNCGISADPKGQPDRWQTPGNWGIPEDPKGQPERCQPQNNWGILEDPKDQPARCQSQSNWYNPADQKGKPEKWQSKMGFWTNSEDRNFQDEIWQTPEGERRIQKIMYFNMQNIDVMSEAEACGIQNVMELSNSDRWRLYRFWVSRLRAKMASEAKILQNEYQITHKLLEEVMKDIDTIILKKACIIGMTTSGAAKHRAILQSIAPKIVVVEEAAEVMEGHIIAALTKDCQHLILIGDHQQLRPNPRMHNLAKDYNLDISLFERQVKNGLPYERLTLQHRMRPRIAALLVPHIYPDLQNAASVEKYEEVKGVAASVFFINHDHSESVSLSVSRANEFEARFLVAFCNYLLLQGYNTSQITILSTYNGQKSVFEKLTMGTIAANVHCTTVDNYQGEENDIILLSLVRSNQKGQVGFLKVSNRICVALSRARKGLYCMGNFDFLEKNTKTWKPIVESMRRDNLIGSQLPLRPCSIHPEFTTLVASEADFNCVLNDGCQVPCLQRLPCGHQCPMMCHVIKDEHSKVECKEGCNQSIDKGDQKCNKLRHEKWKPIVKSMRQDNLIGSQLTLTPRSIHPEFTTLVASKADFNCVLNDGCQLPCLQRLPSGHQCPMMGHVINDEHSKVECKEGCNQSICKGDHQCNKLCHEKCEEWQVLIPKQQPGGHETKLPCNLQAENAMCLEPCERHLPCKHSCMKDGETCDKMDCVKKKLELASCSHLVFVQCNKADDPEFVLQSCNEPCKEMLPCGHRCSGNCSLCKQGRMHLRCKERCDRPLICNHGCIVSCSSNCPPCTQQCENRCIHSKCPNRCGLPCQPCMEPCAWKCQHYVCTKLCHEPCNRPPCDQPCKEVLKCGHQCIGLCGEPCPPLCCECDKEVVQEILFGTEDQKGARFVLMEDCGHVIEASGLDTWMQSEENDTSVTMKKCPKCSMVIKWNLRYSAIIKKIQTVVTVVKEKIFGNIKQVEEDCKKLKGEVEAIAMGYFHFSSCVAQLIDEVSKSAVLGPFELVTLQNKLTFLKAIEKLWTMNPNYIEPVPEPHSTLAAHFESWQPLSIKRHGVPDVNAQKLHACNSWPVINKMLQELADWHQQLNTWSTGKEINDFSRQLGRMNQLSDLLLKTEGRAMNSYEQKCYNGIYSLLVCNRPFSAQMENEVKSEVTRLNNLMPELGISEVEKVEILQAMGLTPGHWFKCPKGHVYAIGDCSGAMQEGTCPECNSAIGGHSHRLIHDNHMATEMDGATSPAWPMDIRVKLGKDLRIAEVDFLI